jgi:hypothetical protein
MFQFIVCSASSSPPSTYIILALWQ